MLTVPSCCIQEMPDTIHHYWFLLLLIWSFMQVVRCMCFPSCWGNYKFFCVANSQVNNLFTSLQTKGYPDCLYLPSFPPLCPFLLLLSFCLSIFFSSRELILSNLFPTGLCWLCDRNHAMQVPWQQVECILPLSANLPHLMTQAEWGVWVCVYMCVQWIHLTCTCGKKPWVSETDLSSLSSCTSSIVSKKNEKS